MRSGFKPKLIGGGIIAAAALVLAAAALTALAPAARADRAAELQVKIDERNQQIRAPEEEIAGYQKSLNENAKQAGSLQSEIKQIETTLKKLNADIKITENKIANAEEKIQQLGLAIDHKSLSIEQNRASLEESLRYWRETEEIILLEQLIDQQTLAEFWSEEEKLNKLQAQINRGLGDLRRERTELSDSKTATEAEQKKLLALKNQLADQKKIANQNRAEKEALLKETKNEEANYRKILAAREAQKNAFTRELEDFEAQLQIAVDPSKLPSAGSGVLAWPLDSIFVTQLFGRTEAAKRLYVSGSHNGVDFRAAVGTPVKAARSGVVTAVGNTDIQPGCYSYGQWVLIDHQNGLSTLYAHLSLIKVAAGQNVFVGQLVGYSGRTGYATGPHLHFTVYATEGLRVERYVNSIHCKNVTIPIADPKAYLDPMIYL